jgi:hypothetical protein
MPQQLHEIKESLEELISNLKDYFGEFEFETTEGLTLDDLSSLDGFEKFFVSGGNTMGLDVSFEVFKKKIKKTLFSNESDLKVSDFDWDEIESAFNDITDAYSNYNDFKDSLSENITGSQTLESVKLYDREELKEYLLNQFIEKDMIYELMHGSEEILILNSALEVKLD